MQVPLTLRSPASGHPLRFSRFWLSLASAKKGNKVLAALEPPPICSPCLFPLAADSHVALHQEEVASALVKSSLLDNGTSASCPAGGWKHPLGVWRALLSAGGAKPSKCITNQVAPFRNRCPAVQKSCPRFPRRMPSCPTCPSHPTSFPSLPLPLSPVTAPLIPSLPQRIPPSLQPALSRQSAPCFACPLKPLSIRPSRPLPDPSASPRPPASSPHRF